MGSTKHYKTKQGKILFHTYQEIESLFRFHLERLSDRINENDVHYLRRAGKKLKAFYLFSGYAIDKRILPKRFKPVKPVYEAAGKFREIQVNINTIKTYLPSVEFSYCYEQYVKPLLKKKEQQLHSEIQKFSISKEKKSIKKTQKLCKSLNKTDFSRAAKSMLLTQIDIIDAARNNTTDNENIHQIRISLKKTSLACSLMQAIKAEGFDQSVLTVLKNAENRLGYWHDRDVLLHSLRHMQENKNLSDIIKTELASLENKLIAEDTLLKWELDSFLKPGLEKLFETINEI